MWHVEMYKVVDGAMWDFGIHSCNYNTRIYGTEVSPFEKGKLSPQTIQGSPKSVFGDPVSIQGSPSPIWGNPGGRNRAQNKTRETKSFENEVEFGFKSKVDPLRAKVYF